MPKYTSKKKRGQKRNRERIKRAIPRDRRHLLQWAVEGTDANYEQLREHAAGLLDQVPSYIDKDPVAAIASGASRDSPCITRSVRLPGSQRYLRKNPSIRPFKAKNSGSRSVPSQWIIRTVSLP